ncbi:rod shape-determining protein MreC [Nitrosophilus kaiyonis]|uniref:rod shape-determining protein MreC n=1 Tax=Nitrosophilus kaiyonis TaxID=2930200 RepID=UPI00249273C9|nr:rod shape-determining protein MreC [Nitrosophilus kaiyonis]
MNKKFILYLTILLLFIGGIKFNFLQKELQDFTNFIKIKYHQINDYLENIILLHLNQEETIENLLLQNRELEKYKLQFNAIKDELQSIKKECNSSIKNSFDIKLVRAISYSKLGDFSSVWIDFKDFNKTKIYGLVKDDFAAGIVVEKNSKPLALLNSNKKCAYAVEIGDVRAPGVAIGHKNGIMKVKFIPMHKQIKVGDEVVTSGMDNIFFYGIKVGKVIKIKERGSYKVAEIKPYADISHPKYFWVIINN